MTSRFASHTAARSTAFSRNSDSPIKAKTSSVRWTNFPRSARKRRFPSSPHSRAPTWQRIFSPTSPARATLPPTLTPRSNSSSDSQEALRMTQSASAKSTSSCSRRASQNRSCSTRRSRVDSTITPASFTRRS